MPGLRGHHHRETPRGDPRRRGERCTERSGKDLSLSKGRGERHHEGPGQGLGGGDGGTPLLTGGGPSP